MTEQIWENADLLRLRREGIETKVVIDHHESDRKTHTRFKLFRQATQNCLTLDLLFDRQGHNTISMANLTGIP